MTPDEMNQFKSFASDLKYDMMRSGQWNEFLWTRRVEDEMRQIGHSEMFVKSAMRVLKDEVE